MADKDIFTEKLRYKLTKNDIFFILGTSFTNTFLANKFGVTPGHIRHIRSGERYASLTNQFIAEQYDKQVDINKVLETVNSRKTAAYYYLDKMSLVISVDDLAIRVNLKTSKISFSFNTRLEGKRISYPETLQILKNYRLL